MERVSWRGNVSLRYGVSQRSFENEASSSAMAATVKGSDSDVDFDDVFGGPPTRTRYSFGGGRIKSSEESRSSPVGLGERPVFGESYSSPRRRTSDDFYDDIFRRSDESVRSPRWSSTTPGSRTLSPANPKIEPIVGSVPTEFSLPAKMTKFVDIPVFGSNSHSNTSLSRFSSPSSQGRNVFRDNPGQSPGQTMFSRESSGAKESIYPTRVTEEEIGHNSKHRTEKTGSPSSEFHFSIHKWANVGVPLLMSLRGGKYPTLKGNSRVSALSMENMQDTAFPNDDLSIEIEDTKKPVLGTGKTEVVEKEISTKKQQVDDQKIVPPSSLLHDEVERQGYVGREAEGKQNTEATSGVTSSEVGSTRKKKAESKKRNSTKKTEANKPAIISPKSSPKSRVKGMVKDFFKMSNQDSPPKPKTNVVSGSLSSRWKTTVVIDPTQEELIDTLLNSDTTVPDTSNKIQSDDKAPAGNVKMVPDASEKTKSFSEMQSDNVKMASDSSNKAKLDSKVPAENVNMNADDSSNVKEDIGRSNKPKYPQNRTIKKLEDIYFQKDASQASESVSSGSKITVENIDDPSIDTFQVEELAPDDNKLSKTQDDSQAIKELDSKIHLWSSGRKGNIRSLLSTLQLVLWPDSGWKPVKLVDIIEANAVKKSYNRAMLCLHPDKLQQKGVDSHKKYVAEKVFDILQEAWDHFNTLGTLL